MLPFGSADNTGQRIQSKDAQMIDNITVCMRRNGSGSNPYRIAFSQPEYEEVLVHTSLANNEAPYSFTDVANRRLFYQYVPPKVSGYTNVHFQSQA